MRTFSLFAFVLAACHSTEPVTGSGNSVYTADVETIELVNNGGGFGPLPPPGPCNPRIAHYTVTIAGQHLAWELCDVVHTQPPTTAPRNGDRALTAAEWDALEPKLEDLVIDTRDTCGVDKPELLLIVTASSWMQQYGDSFYNCQTPGPNINTDALDALQAAMFSLAE